MNKLFILIAVLGIYSVPVFSQNTPKFNLTKDGISPVVLNFDAGLTANQIYKKVKEWIAINYKNEGIRIDNENTLVKIGAFKPKAWKIRDNNFDYWYQLEYTLNIDIKDSKCRVTLATPEDKYKIWYNKDGSTIAKFKDSEATFEASINEILTSLYKHIKEPKKVAKDDW